MRLICAKPFVVLKQLIKADVFPNPAFFYAEFARKSKVTPIGKFALVKSLNEWKCQVQSGKSVSRSVT